MTTIPTPSFSDLPPPLAIKDGWPWVEQSLPRSEAIPTGTPTPRISIVTPSYNQAQFLEETIRSVLLQSYPDLEYIVMDGGSTDGSVEILNKYEPWLTYWISEPDDGQAHAINKGFEHATGDIYGWINSDDSYLPNALQTVAKNLSGKMGMVVGAAIEKNIASGKSKQIFKKRTSDELLYLRRTILQPSTFWNADLWDACGKLDEEYDFALDYELWLRMFKYAESITYLDEPLSIINVHADQKTNDANSSQIALEPFLAVMKNISLWEISPWKLFYQGHKMVHWKERGIRRYIPNLDDLPILMYPFARKLSIYFAKKWL